MIIESYTCIRVMCTIKILSLVHGPRELKQHMIQAIRSELQQFQNPWGL